MSYPAFYETTRYRNKKKNIPALKGDMKLNQVQSVESEKFGSALEDNPRKTVHPIIL